MKCQQTPGAKGVVQDGEGDFLTYKIDRILVVSLWGCGVGPNLNNFTFLLVPVSLKIVQAPINYNF